jgi:hypothetical protein
MNEHTKPGRRSRQYREAPARALTERIVWRGIGDLKQFPAIPRSIRIDSRLGPEGDTR